MELMTLNKFAQIKQALKYHKEISINQADQNKNDFYRCDRSHAAQYFSIHEPWRKKITQYFGELKSKRNKIVHLDICGRANAKSLGADKSYLFSFKTSDFAKRTAYPWQIYFDGDLFDSKDFSQFLTLVSKGKVAPALVTFEPVAGLQEYTPNIREGDKFPLYKEVTYGQLKKRLRSIIEILKPGGYIYVERPFQLDVDIWVAQYRQIPVREWAISVAIKEIAKSGKCKVEIRKEITGIYFLLRKRIPKKPIK